MQNTRIYNKRFKCKLDNMQNKYRNLINNKIDLNLLNMTVLELDTL